MTWPCSDVGSQIATSPIATDGSQNAWKNPSSLISHVVMDHQHVYAQIPFLYLFIISRSSSVPPQPFLRHPMHRAILIRPNLSWILKGERTPNPSSTYLITIDTPDPYLSQPTRNRSHEAVIRSESALPVVQWGKVSQPRLTRRNKKTFFPDSIWWSKMWVQLFWKCKREFFLEILFFIVWAGARWSFQCSHPE